MKEKKDLIIISIIVLIFLGIIIFTNFLPHKNIVPKNISSTSKIGERDKFGNRIFEYTDKDAQVNDSTNIPYDKLNQNKDIIIDIKKYDNKDDDLYIKLFNNTEKEIIIDVSSVIKGDDFITRRPLWTEKNKRKIQIPPHSELELIYEKYLQSLSTDYISKDSKIFIIEYEDMASNKIKSLISFDKFLDNNIIKQNN